DAARRRSRRRSVGDGFRRAAAHRHDGERAHGDVLGQPTMTQTRRQATRMIVAGAVGCALALPRQNALAADNSLGGLRENFAALEAESGGRLGVAVLRSGSEGFAGHRADERFPICSTFKLLAAAAVLKLVDEGKETLDRRVKFATG